MTPAQAQEAGLQAAKLYDTIVAPASGGGAPPAAPPATPAPTQEGNMQKGVYAVQQLVSQGYNKQQIREGLIQRGATTQQVEQLLNAAGVQQ